MGQVMEKADNNGKERPDPIKICNELFGDFDIFHKYFLNIKFGGMPASAHPKAHAIAKIRNMNEWPKNYRQLRHMAAICYECTNKSLIKDCKCSLKAMVGECEAFFMEATREDARLNAEINKKKKTKR